MGSGKKTVLIVDDNAFFLKQQESYLDKGRFSVITATSGREALEKADASAPDLILLDNIMQDMTGPKVCRILKAKRDTAHIPVIIVSSGEREHSRKEASEAGAEGIIFKPIRREQLLALVEEYLGASFRKWSRIPVSLKCEVRTQEFTGEGEILSLGAGGVFLRIGFPLVRGDACQLRFSLGDSSRDISTREALVVWMGKMDKTGPKGVGMKFITISEDDRASIERFVAGTIP